MSIHHDEDKWSIDNILIRIIAYPFCITFIFAGIFIGFITFEELNFISKKECFIGFGLAIFLISFPFLYLYPDLKSIFSKDGNDKESDILDDGI